MYSYKCVYTVLINYQKIYVCMYVCMYICIYMYMCEDYEPTLRVLLLVLGRRLDHPALLGRECPCLRHGPLLGHLKEFIKVHYKIYIQIYIQYVLYIDAYLQCSCIEKKKY